MLSVNEIWKKLLAPEKIERGCACGRSLEKPHCVACGSTNTYALAFPKRADLVTLPGTDEQVRVPILRCRKCGVSFNIYLAATGCEAPTMLYKNMTHRRNEDRAIESLDGLSDEERMDVMERLFKDIK